MRFQGHEEQLLSSLNFHVRYHAICSTFVWHDSPASNDLIVRAKCVLHGQFVAVFHRFPCVYFSANNVHYINCDFDRELCTRLLKGIRADCHRRQKRLGHCAFHSCRLEATLGSVLFRPRASPALRDRADLVTAAAGSRTRERARTTGGTSHSATSTLCRRSTKRGSRRVVCCCSVRWASRARPRSPSRT